MTEARYCSMSASLFASQFAIPRKRAFPIETSQIENNSSLRRLALLKTRLYVNRSIGLFKARQCLVMAGLAWC